MEPNRSKSIPATLSPLSLPTLNGNTAGNNVSQINRVTFADNGDDNVDQKPKIPIRTFIAILSIFGCVLLSSTRYNLSIAIVDMVDESCTPQESVCGAMNSPGGGGGGGVLDKSLMYTHINDNQSLLDQSLSMVEVTLDVSKHHHLNYTNKILNCTRNGTRKLDWSEAQQGLSLGVYYYGYAATHVFGGRLSERIGPKWVTATGLICAAILNIFLPISSKYSFALFSIIRALVGAFHGVVHPALFYMFHNWFPKKEQSLALSMLLMGTSMGLVINVPIVLAIADLDILDGWPLLFYGGSALHIIWLILWIMLAADKPEVHRHIKDREIVYIRQNSVNLLENNHAVPWRQILTSKVVYASIVAKICWSFNHAVIIDNGPSYLNKIAGFDMYRASVHIAMVYLCTAVIFICSGSMFTFVRKCSSLSVTRLRKLFQTIVFFGAFITMFILPSVGCDETKIFVLLIINMLTQGFVASGEYPIINECAGNYSGTVYGIAFTFDSLTRFIAPIIRGELVKIENTLDNWNIIFYINAVLNIIGFIVFQVCATTTVQHWALKRDFFKQISHISNNNVEMDEDTPPSPLEKETKKELKKELQNPNFRISINTNTNDWKEFKTSTLVQ